MMKLDPWGENLAQFEQAARTEPDAATALAMALEVLDYHIGAGSDPRTIAAWNRRVRRLTVQVAPTR